MERVSAGRAELSGVTDGDLHRLISQCLRLDPRQRPSAEAVLAQLGPSQFSLQGTGWLPAAVAQEIDRRTALARHPPSPPVGQLSVLTGEPTADPVVMGLPTVDPTIVPAPPAPRSPLSRRSFVIGAVGASVLAGGVAVGLATTQHRARQPAPSTTEAARALPSVSVPLASLKWTVRLGGYFPDVVTMAGGLVLVWIDKTIHALDPATGRQRWSRAGSRGSATGDLAYTSDATQLQLLTAIHASSGATAWTYVGEPDYPDSDVVVAGSVACFGYERTHGLSVSSGSPLWTANFGAKEGIDTTAGVVVVLQDVLVGLEASTGRKKWSYQIADALFPLAGDAMVFVCDKQGTLHALRADNGQHVWQRSDYDLTSGFQCGSGILYTTRPDGQVRALRTRTGELVWSQQVGHGEGRVAGTSNMLTLTGTMLYVAGTDKMTYALDATSGRVLWTYAADVMHNGGPVAAGALVFIGTRDGSVQAISPRRPWEPPVQALEFGDPASVGRFQVLARIGAGGMGTVYLGRSPAGRSVAVKVVHPVLAADPEIRDRFRREVWAAQAIGARLHRAAGGHRPRCGGPMAGHRVPAGGVFA